MLEQIINTDTALTLLINGSHSLWLDGFAMAVTSTITWIPAALILLYVIIRHGDTRDIILTVLAVGLCVLIADQIASGLFKPLVGRWRPTNDPILMLSVDVVNGYRGGRFGFFSSHAANTFAIATFLALLIRHRLLSIVMFTWAMLNGWSRIYLGVHYLGDVLVGTLCGILVGTFVYWLYGHLCSKRERVVPSFDVQTASGFAILDARLLAGSLLVLFTFCSFAGLWFN